VTAFILRFLGAGLLVAALPTIAAQLGDRFAGLVLLFPVVTASGFLVLGLDHGTAAVADASLASIAGLPTVAVFLLTVHVASRNGLGLPWVLGIGVSAWLAAASIVAAVAARPGGAP
jgi:uncharacterized membrane protein (GlpM family)